MRRKIGATLLSGLLATLSYLPHPAWNALAWLAYVPLLCVLDSARPRVAVGLTALATAVLVATSLWGFMGIHWGLYLATLIALPLARALLFALPYSYFRPWLPRLLLAPTLWVLSDYVISLGPLGFSGLTPGYTQAFLQPLLQIASLAGIWGVTFLLIMGNTFLVELWRAAYSKQRLYRSAWLAPTLLGLALLWGSFILRGEGSSLPNPQEEIALIQGYSPLSEDLDSSASRYLQHTRSLVSSNPKPDLIIWPETTASPVHEDNPTGTLAALKELAKTHQVEVIIGSAFYTKDENRYNSALAILPTGAMPTYYAKRHLVPFGEYIPFEGFFQRIGIARIPAYLRTLNPDNLYAAGSQAIIFPLQMGKVGSLICFEDNFPALARTTARLNASYLLVLGADTWFAGTRIPAQHAYFSPFRAVENRTYLLRADNYGPTMVVDPYGRVLARLPIGEEAVLRVTLPRYQRLKPTLALRFGPWLPWFCLILLSLAAFIRKIRQINVF